jgi:urease accessory protein
MALALDSVPSIALAHLVNSGLGPFYDGAMHLAFSPGDLLGLVAATLLAGLCGARAGRLTVIAMPIAWCAAGLLGLYLPFTTDLAWFVVLSLVTMGALVAIDPKLPAPMVAALAAAYGALHGLLNGSALRIIGAGPMSLLGIVVSVVIIALLISAAVVSLRPAWTRIAVRVMGSWVAAVGMLMFGWLAKGAG